MPPPPIPSFFYMEMIPNIDTQLHSSSLDSEHKSIYTPILDFFPVDIFDEIKEMETEKQDGWLIRASTIDSSYYQEKSERNEIFMRNESKLHIEDLLDYPQ